MKQQVLIYYANETCLSLERLRAAEERTEWMRRYGDAGAVALATRVSDDLRRFPRTTQRHLVELRRIARDSGLIVVIFTNELAKVGWYESQAADVSCREPFRAAAGRPLLADAPLSSPASLLAAFRETARRFPPSRHEFVLITRSHGTEIMAITSAMIEETLERPPVAGESLADKLDLGWAELGADYLGMFNLGAFYGIGEKGMVLGGMKEASEGAGMTKRQYLDVVEASGEDFGMEFRLVFMDSCGSEIPCDLSREVPRNIHTLFGSRPEGLTYEAPDFARIGADLEVPDRPDGFSDVFQSLLEETPNVTRFVLDDDCGRRRRL